MLFFVGNPVAFHFPSLNFFIFYLSLLVFIVSFLYLYLQKCVSVVFSFNNVNIIYNSNFCYSQCILSIFSVYSQYLCLIQIFKKNEEKMSITSLQLVMYCILLLDFSMNAVTKNIYLTAHGL